ncbi:class I SAM-dependent methyltransferase [Kineococcus rhizosphaerae]|uniref:Methyltransferase family protein n=1 Tax=Kineococcus rhizosphaerae TaxID=559628 RepID=A0A2T0RAF3_9ACTN|nr:class I SAM-dependent methyltransferase [Kineococcus rhizosphaerae]PRY18146.1 methyltransferase family protein [Kineococcus rhizosphaerae]
MSDETRRYWDEQAATFDDEADHGLRDPAVRQAWADLLLPLVPPAARVADLGCGTGSLSVLLAGVGHDAHGVDLSPRMIDAARAKAAAAGVPARFSVADAAAPPVEDGSVDVVLARHVLWAFEDPGEVLGTWTRLLAPGGRLLLVEGRWSTGAGVSAADGEALVRRHREQVQVRMLPEASYWGKDITDERYLLSSTA